MSGLDWLIARPIAHRGLHDPSNAIIENTAGAFSAAVTAGYGIECDLQVSADGEAMVHHDDALGRLTEGSGRLADMSAAALRAVRFKETGDRMLSLGELCDLVGGRATLTLEFKSHFDGDLRLVARAATVLANYIGPVAAMSFDPDAVATLRTIAPSLTRGIVASRDTALVKHFPGTRPHFVAYAAADLPAAAPLIARYLFGLPLLSWTVRNNDESRRALCFADQIIFEGFRP